MNRLSFECLKIALDPRTFEERLAEVCATLTEIFEAEKHERERLQSYAKQHPLALKFIDTLTHELTMKSDALVGDANGLNLCYRHGVLDNCIAYIIVRHDIVKMATIAVCELLDRKGERAELLRFAVRLASAMRQMEKAAGLYVDGEPWAFPPKMAAALREIAKTLRSDQHA